MSRLQMLLDAPVAITTTQRQLGSYLEPKQPTPDLQFPYRLFLPRHYESRYEYPLIVWLHSEHSSEWEIDVIMESLSDRNYIAIAPRGIKRSRRSDRLFRWGTTPSDLALTDEMVWECIQQSIQTLPVNPTKVFLAGFGTAGTVAQWVGLKNIQNVAGVVSINGAFPTSKRALADWKQAKALPTLFMQNAGSTLCTDRQWNEAIKLAHVAGLNYQFWRMNNTTGFSEDSDALDVNMLHAANRFMMGIVTNTQISLEPEQQPAVAPEVAFGLN